MILKVTLQKSTKKFLFAQADDNFVDFLFSILIIPLGRVERLLDSNTCLKNIDNLHRSIADFMDNNYLKPPYARDGLTKPELLDMYVPNRYYYSPYDAGWLHPDLLIEPPYARDGLTKPELLDMYVPNRSPCDAGWLHPDLLIGGRNFVKEARMYMVTDDLIVTPLGITSSLNVLNGMQISLSDVEELELYIGLEEGLSILKASLTSSAALTNGLVNPILNKQPKQEH